MSFSGGGNSWLRLAYVYMADPWTELLTCPSCGKTARAKLSDSDAYEAHRGLMLVGFKELYHGQHSRVFSCVDCKIAARFQPG